jgi:hypothetical protein
MFLLHQSRFTGGRNTSNEKERLRISNPERLQHIVAIEKSKVDIVPGEFRIQFEPRLLQIRRQDASGGGTERRGKGLELIKPYSNSGSHFMPAKLQQVFATFFQGLDHR